tara:strand:+ start:683 stop:1141 length:459 start_codon:yes stop_codon:yes gene_type:complete
METHIFKKAHKEIINDCINERLRQDEKFGANRKHHPAEWLMILGEEVGEVNQEGINYTFTNNSKETTRALENMRAELVQVAAVAMAFIQDLDNHYLKCPTICTSCEKRFELEAMAQDDDCNYFCQECYKELAPIMKAEYDELVRKGEIEPNN